MNTLEIHEQKLAELGIKLRDLDDPNDETEYFDVYLWHMSKECLDYVCMVASDTSIPLHFLERLVLSMNDNSWGEIYDSAEFDISPNTLIAMWIHCDAKDYIAYDLFAHPKFPKEYLEQAWSYPTALATSERKDTPKAVLTELSNHWASIVRLKVALNENTPQKTLTKLAKSDPEELVRIATVWNANAPKTLWKKLSKDISSEHMSILLNIKGCPLVQKLEFISAMKHSYEREAKFATFEKDFVGIDTTKGTELIKPFLEWMSENKRSKI